MEVVLGENKSDNKHRYTKLLLPISPMEVMFSPLTHIHGSLKFVIDSECCHSCLGGFKKTEI